MCVVCVRARVHVRVHAQFVAHGGGTAVSSFARSLLLSCAVFAVLWLSTGAALRSHHVAHRIPGAAPAPALSLPDWRWLRSLASLPSLWSPTVAVTVAVPDAEEGTRPYTVASTDSPSPSSSSSDAGSPYAWLPVSRWSVSDTAQWLEAQGFAEYAEAFAAGGVDGELLLSLQPKDLWMLQVHYTILHYTTLHYTTLLYSILDYSTVHYSTVYGGT